jgi:organic radical activating enzyme
MFVANSINIIKKIIKNFIPYGIIAWHKFHKSFSFEIHITEHCNLNCKCCTHFSSIAKEAYLNQNTFEKDCKRLSLITKRISQIRLLGGEPLLHPQLTTFCDIARKYFRHAQIHITTNGILLLKQAEEFWENCRKNKISIAISNYPIHINREAIEIRASQYKVPLIYDQTVRSTDDEKKKLMYKIPLDLRGKQNIKEMYLHCPHDCITLRDGKLYRCCTIAHIRFFNEYFNENIDITEGDYIDIYKAKTEKDILEYLQGPYAFCRYCQTNKKKNDIEWAVTKKEITEWV